MDKLITLTILKILFQYNRRPIGERHLLTAVNIELADPITKLDLQVNIQAARRKGWIDFQVDNFRATNWWLTDAGAAEASEQGAI